MMLEPTICTNGYGHGTKNNHKYILARMVTKHIGVSCHGVNNEDPLAIENGNVTMGMRG